MEKGEIRTLRILLDTNVLLDFVAKRERYYDDAHRIILLCTRNEINGLIAAHSISNMFYILRRDMSEGDRRETLLELCELFTVVGIDKPKLMRALENKDFRDMEDCLQSECASEYGADYIVTRNVKDFANSSVPVVTPAEFLENLK